MKTTSFAVAPQGTQGELSSWGSYRAAVWSVGVMLFRDRMVGGDLFPRAPVLYGPTFVTRRSRWPGPARSARATHVRAR
jgi:hypothetical protein